MWTYKTLAVVLFALSWTIPGWGQVVGGSISGTVTDESGAPVPEVQIVVRDVETGAERRLASDDNGRYSVPSVPVGRYEIAASKENFKSQTKTGIELVVAQRTVVDFSLQLGDIKQTVTVEEAAAPVELSTAPNSGLVTERQVKDLPLNGRSFDGLITLNPGVVNYTSGRSGGVGTSNSSLGNMFAVSGRRPQENLFLLNGIEFTGASVINITPGGASGQLLGVDAVREFNLVTDTYGAEYGKRPGGQVTIVTASGTNQLHGTAYEFLRNDVLDARNFFDQGEIPQFQRNVFGGALGGPLKKNKLFLFGNYEGFRQHLGLSDVTLVPDNNARAGLLPDGKGGLTNVGLGAGVAPLFALWPTPNGPELGGGIAEAFSHPLQTVREDFGTARLDYNISSSDSLFGVYTVDDSGDDTPSSNPLSTAIEQLREQVISLEEQHVFSPTVLNTARVGYSRASFFFTGATPVDLPGWEAGQPIGAIVIGGGTALNAASQVGPAGTNAGSNLRAVRNLFTYDDHVVFTHGAHQIEIGGWLQQIQANDNMAQNQFGQATFSSLTSFLKGSIATFSVVPTPTALAWRSVEGAGFVQDAIKLRKNLDLRVGFRFESTNGWNEAHDRASNYVFSNGVIQTDPVVGHSVFTQNRAKFLPEPRVGLAWDPFGKNKTVIHAGFGIYRALLDSIDYRLDQTAPFNTTQTLKNVPLSGLLIVPGTPAPAGAKISPSGIQPDAYTPTVLTWSFRVEQQIAPDTSLTLGYVGSHGYHELLSVDANIPFPSLNGGAIYFPTGAPLANPALANTTSWLSEGLSSYNALQVDVSRRFRHGFQIRGVYTFAKSLDDGTALNSSVGANAPGFVMYPLNPKIDWSLSTADVRNSGVINGTWELPVGRGRALLGNAGRWAQAVAGGWTVSGIATLQSGLPFTPSLGYNPSNDGDSRNPVRPTWNPAYTEKVVTGGPNQYFNPNAFVTPAAGTYGNVGRDTLIGPGVAEIDFSALKVVNVTERVRVQFRAEFFNILNHTNFGTPNTVVFTSATAGPSPTAGVITGTSTTSRQIQFGLKLLW
jgi:hypothetical protein